MSDLISNGFWGSSQRIEEGGTRKRWECGVWWYGKAADTDYCNGEYSWQVHCSLHEKPWALYAFDITTFPGAEKLNIE